MAYCDTHEWYAGVLAQAVTCLHAFKAVLSRTRQCTSMCDILKYLSEATVSMQMFCLCIAVTYYPQCDSMEGYMIL